MAKDNFEIGKITVDGIPLTDTANFEEVDVTFSIDANGILNVSAVCRSNRNARGEITIKNVCGSPTKAEIEKMIADADMYRKEDVEVKRLKTARSELEEFCYELRDDCGPKNSLISVKCKEVISWLDSCCRPTIAQFVQMKDKLKALTAPGDEIVKNENIDVDEANPNSLKIKIKTEEN